MITFDPYILTFGALFLAVMLPFAWLVCKGTTQRLMLVPIILGFTFYNGFAISTTEAPTYMIVGYFLFIIALIAGFRFGAVLAHPLGVTIARNATPVLSEFAEGRMARQMILFYFILIFITLVVPTFKVHLLLAPPNPDIRALFDARFTESRGAIGAMIAIFTALTKPLYYLALYRYRHRLGLLAALVLAPLYMQYVRDAYIGRYEILFSLIYIFMMAWAFKPRWRTALGLGALLALPVLATLAHAYTFTRLGNSADYSGSADALLSLLEAETMLPIEIGIPLVESGQRGSLIGYVVWLLTLPIPGFLKSGLPIMLVNYEISEIVLGRPPGSQGFYVVLPGLIGESMFLYGKEFYLLHPLTIGLIIGMFAAILQNIPRMNALIYFVVILFFFNLNRGGVASVMPVLINGFLLFGIIVFFAILREQQRRAERARRPDRA